MTDRGGQCLKAGKIGRVNVLRQQMMMPGEVITPYISGQVKLESLRERDSLRINANLSTFMTPIRWLWSDWPEYVKQGPAGTTYTPPLITENDMSRYGIGCVETDLSFEQYWKDAVLKVYNEWYKWPEAIDQTAWPGDGQKAVPLQRAWTRSRDQITPDNSEDYTVASATEFDVRRLAEVEAKFRSAMERDVLSYKRWMEVCKEMFGASGSREVDQVPIMVDQTELGVNPREIPATDGPSLGQWQSMFDFGVDHKVGAITAPEHCILTYVLVIRFAPLTETRHGLASGELEWAERVGDPEVLGSMQPQSVMHRELFATNQATAMGYQPAGWQWRHGHDVISARIDERDSFPYHKLPSNVEEARDATRINPAFRSEALGDYVADLWFSEPSKNMLNTALESYYSGMQGENAKAEYPKQGKMV